MILTKTLYISLRSRGVYTYIYNLYVKPDYLDIINTINIIYKLY